MWTAYRNRNGYGTFGVDGRSRLAHRAAYHHWIGQFAPGLEPDHLCRVRACVNPTHLEPVTHRENNMRGIRKSPRGEAFRARTHCEQGHPFDETNTGWKKNAAGRRWRYCRTCVNRRNLGKVAKVPSHRTHCANGHALDETNTVMFRGYKRCRACNREWSDELRRRRGQRKRDRSRCAHGHVYDEANTYRAKNGTRACRECMRQYQRRLRAERRNHAGSASSTSSKSKSIGCAPTEA